METTIRNDRISVSVESRGAEQQSFRDLVHNREWLWQGDPTYWSGRSPNLFPIVGRVVDDHYTWQGRRYRLEGHGFAPSSEFELVERREDTLIYELRSDERTRELYPFVFALRATYRLRGPAVVCGFEVRNTGASAMLFSVGGHPGFHCEQMETCYLEFEVAESAERRMHPSGLLDGTRRPFLRGERRAVLSHELFREGAVILERLKSPSVTLGSRAHERRVKVTIGGMPYLGIWSPAQPSPFVCIEPWHGVPSTVGDDPDLGRKEGMLRLEPGGTFRCEYAMEAL